MRVVRPRPPSSAAATAPIQTLVAAPPSASAEALASAETQTESLLAGEQQRLAANPPTMIRPTGLPADPAAAAPSVAETPATVTCEPAAEVPEAPPVLAEPPAPPPVPVEVAAGFAGASARAVARASVRDEGGILATIAAPLDVFQLLQQAGSLNDVDTSAGERPTIALADDLDPTRAEQAAAPSDAATADAEALAAAGRAEDPRMDGIRPTVVPGAASGKVGAVGTAELPEPIMPEEISDEVARGFDQGAAEQWAQATAEASAKHDAAFAERRSGEAHEWAATDAKILAAEQKATIDQQAAIAVAQGEAVAANAAWATELEAARGTYQTSRSQAISDLHRDVEARRSQGENEAAHELAEGERLANKEKTAKQAEVDAERARVESESEESDGFFGWLADQVEDLFDALADFINDAFNWLREKVAEFIDAAKELARWAINKARDAINGIINLAADALELAANIFLVAFPEARDRAKQWINDARNTAIDAVNSAADWLADQVDKALDALGAALDFILSVYQRAYLAILEAIRFLVVGFLIIMRNIARLVNAARAMPDYFEGAVEAELIGQDLTQPLFFERTARPGTSEAAALASAMTDAGQTAANADLALLGQDKLTDDQAMVDQVADFNPDPAFIESLALEDGGEIMFGGTDSPEANAEAHLAAALGAAPEGGTPETGAAGVAPASEASAIVAGDDTETRLQQLMDAEPDGACEAQSAPSGQQNFPEEQKFGPLTRGQRARYLLSQMGKGIRQWFSCNWPWLLAAVIAALVGIIILEILTAGAITAALPILLELLAVVMIGVAVIRAGPHILDYLVKGWDGDILGAAQSLAKGLAVGAVELIFAILTYITAGAFRVLAAGARAAGALARTGARGAARLGQAAARMGRTGVRRTGQLGRRLLRSTGRVGRSGRVALVRGRLVFRGLRRGFARGVRSLDELGERLGRHFRFRGFSISRTGFIINLWGHFNARVLLASADIRTIRSSARKVGQRTRTAEGEAAIVIGRGRGSSTFVRSLERNARRVGGSAENQDFFRQLWNAADDAARRRIIYNRTSTRALRRGIPGPSAPPLYQAHHIAPRELLSTPSIRNFFRRIGFNIEDGLHNGVMLPPTAVSRTGYWSKAAVHLGSHSNYTKRMATAIRDIQNRYARAVGRAGADQAKVAAAGQRALGELQTLLANTRSNLIKGVEVLD
jgi:hypothetical protein